ncbi:MAG: mechanosensitive ion channel family protein [Cytophagales bacterium]|nr:mechanosensitive ion channel family protein [Cytophagales bacterium]
MLDAIQEAVRKIYDKLLNWVETLIVMLPNLLLAVIIFCAFYYTGRFARRALQKPMARVIHTRAIMDLLLNLLSMAFIAIGLFVALSVLQLDKAVTSLLAGAGIVGLALGFAFQDIAANFVSGVLIALRKPIEIGDLIESNGFFGIVSRVTLRSTIIRTMPGQQVHIPNKDIYSKPIVNYSALGKRRVDLDCGVSYGDDLERVREVALRAVRSLPYLDTAYEVELFFKEFGESSINFTVRYWISFKRQADYLKAVSDGIVQIKKAFDAEGITIPFPIRTLDFGIKGGEKLAEQITRAPQPKESNGREPKQD